MKKLPSAMWRTRIGHNVDPNELVRWLEKIRMGKAATARQIVDEGRTSFLKDVTSFLWYDDKLAADKYRLLNARRMLSDLVMLGDDERPIRYYCRVSLHDVKGYLPMVEIVANARYAKNVIANYERQAQAIMASAHYMKQFLKEYRKHEYENRHNA